MNFTDQNRFFFLAQSNLSGEATGNLPSNKQLFIQTANYKVRQFCAGLPQSNHSAVNWSLFFDSLHSHLSFSSTRTQGMVVAVKAIPKSKVELNRPLLLELKRVGAEVYSN